ncbi:MAG: UDP-N-acetylmuramoyl-tripeptide--D-alanyl-D-alanine ligase [Halanaerobiaceae bacterium]
MPSLTTEKVLEAVAGDLIQGPRDVNFQGVSIDSRTIEPGELFVAIIGENFDGHSFVEDALNKGARGVIVDRKLALETKKPMIRVSDTTLALQELAHYYRGLFPELKVIGVTGSAGKTTTKDLLASVLKEKYNVLKTEENLNNHYGLPLTLFNLKGQEDFAVLEMGMSARGEIRRLAEIARPDIGIVTNVGSAHLETLKTKENVARAKSELIQELPEDGLAVLNYDDQYVSEMKNQFSGKDVLFFSLEDKRADIYACDFNHETDREPGISFTVIEDNKKERYQLTKPGLHNVYNALPACALGSEFGLSAAQIRAGLLKCDYSSLRMEFIEKKDYLIINDSYNSNPLSLKSALKVLQETGSGRKIAVLGAMLELGEKKVEAHREIGEYIADSEIDILITRDKLMSYAAREAEKQGMSRKQIFSFSDKYTLTEKLKKMIKPADTILFKGSRGSKMDEIVDLLVEGEDGE